MEDVMIRIKGFQMAEEQGEDSIEFITEAQVYERNGTRYLIYEESELSGMPGCKTRLRMRNDEIQLKRFGDGAAIGGEMCFRKGQRFQSEYQTPYGVIEMEILTNDLTNTLFALDNEDINREGQINIDYDISLKGLMEGRNRINITVM